MHRFKPHPSKVFVSRMQQNVNKTKIIMFSTNKLGVVQKWMSCHCDNTVDNKHEAASGQSIIV